MSNAKQIKLKHGTLSEAARRLGIPRQWAHEGWRKERPQIVEMVAQIVAEQVEQKRRKDQLINQIAEHTKAVINQ